MSEREISGISNEIAQLSYAHVHRIHRELLRSDRPRVPARASPIAGLTRSRMHVLTVTGGRLQSRLDCLNAIARSSSGS